MLTVRKITPATIRFALVFCAVVLSAVGCRAQSKIENPGIISRTVKDETAAVQNAATTDAPKVKFSSAYTKLDSVTCQPFAEPESEEDEVPDICDGYKNYKIFVSHHGAATTIHIGTEISRATDSWDPGELPTFVANNAGNGQTIEWRLADGVPFACIVRAEYDKSLIDPDEKGTANELVVKNLKGFAPISVTIDAQKNKRANEEARRAADAAYRKL